MIKEAIGTLVLGKALTAEESGRVMEEIMEGKATSAQLSAFLTALSIKGETGDEIAGLARVMRDKAIQVKVDGPALDIVGTGGDGLNTFNISTAAAMVAAGAGLKVAKHGNRAATSKCGSADVLEKLGVRINLGADQVQRCIQEIGIGFMFAPVFHPAMKYAAGPRKEIGIRTVFNILGPLTNPARAEYQVIGVPNIPLGEQIVPALIQLKSKHALVVHGLNGMDEISITDSSLIWEIKNQQLISFRRISPADFDFNKATDEDIRGGTPEENAETLVKILTGDRGAKRNIVILNAAAALLAGEKVSQFNDGILLAEETIDSGKAAAKLRLLIDFTQELTDKD
jgi:anthranilate phosphoribosyltransferase